MTTFNMVSDSIRNEDGSINVGATVEKFESQVQQYAISRELENSNVGAAVDEVFDSYSSARVNVPFVVGQVLNKLGYTPATHLMLTNAIKTYIHKNTGKTREDGKKFTVKLGKGGGMQAWKNIEDKK